jgi:hypothetical protein
VMRSGAMREAEQGLTGFDRNVEFGHSLWEGTFCEILTLTWGEQI